MRQIRPHKRKLILDPIHPRDYRTLTIIHYCEQCAHFDHGNRECTIGFDASNHVKAAQDKQYELNGRVAFCRFCEID